MATKNVSLPPDLEEYIDAKVATGEYAHASEVVRDALRIMMQQEAEKLEWLRNALAEAEADVAAGRVIPADRILEEVRKGAAALRKRRGKGI